MALPWSISSRFIIGTFADDDDGDDEGSDISDDDDDEEDLMGNGQQQPLPHTALSECVRLLKSSTDEQRFVGLLLATKQVKSLADLTVVFNAGMPFVHRLLLTPGGGNSEVSDASSPFRALALSVLASFASSPELVARYAFGRCAPMVGSLLREFDERGMSEDELRNCSAVLVALRSYALVALVSVLVCAAGTVVGSSHAWEDPGGFRPCVTRGRSRVAVRVRNRRCISSTRRSNLAPTWRHRNERAPTHTSHSMLLCT